MKMLFHCFAMVVGLFVVSVLHSLSPATSAPKAGDTAGRHRAYIHGRSGTSGRLAQMTTEGLQSPSSRPRPDSLPTSCICYGSGGQVTH